MKKTPGEIIKGIMPSTIKEKSEVDSYSLKKFIEKISKEIPKGTLLLDAGCGWSQYRDQFQKTTYMGTDISVFNGQGPDFISDLHHIPVKEGVFDAALNTQVLEHVKDPKQVLSEIQRVLKQGGRLYLTAAQGWSVHEAPYDFYRYTSFGLKHLLKESGFKVDYIRPRGGYFWFIGRWLFMLPHMIYSSRLYAPTRNPIKKMLKFCGRIALEIPFCYIIPYLCFYLDGLDEKRDTTLGYECRATKRR